MVERNEREGNEELGEEEATKVHTRQIYAKEAEAGTYSIAIRVMGYSSRPKSCWQLAFENNLFRGQFRSFCVRHDPKQERNVEGLIKEKYA